MTDIKTNEDSIKSMEASLHGMASALQNATQQMTLSMEQLQAEVKEIKETRYKPYFTSVGLFVAVTLAVVGYVYGLESRSTRSFFEMGDRIASVDTLAELNKQNNMINEERSEARLQHAMRREETHAQTHENLNRQLRDLTRAMFSMAAADLDEAEEHIKQSVR